MIPLKKLTLKPIDPAAVVYLRQNADEMGGPEMTETEGGVRMLCAALEMERGERGFYQKAAESCPNEFGKAVFRMLGEEEADHAKYLQAIYEVIKGGRPWPEQCALYDREQRDARRVIEDVAGRHGALIEAGAGAPEALGMAMDLERKSVKFYRDRLHQATDPLERKFIERMIEEERGHFLILSDMQYYYSYPEGYFMEKEHRGLDGA